MAGTATPQTPAAPVAPALVNIKIDGVPYQVPKGANLLDVCLKAGQKNKDYPDQREGGPHYVPHFCYHPGLTVAGNCRMCFVKTTTQMKQPDGSFKPMVQYTTSCTNTAAEGLEVDTKSADVTKIQAGIMDLLLINHPLDCPECDKAGECRLQDYDFDYGHDHSKFEFEKVDRHIKSLGNKITIWGTRCIQCSRCIRVCDEVTGTSELAFVNRGDRTVIDIFPGKPIENPLTLNTVEVCPVGALKNKDFLYTARVWNLDEMPGVCGLCAKGCAIRVDSLKGDIKRVMARENLDVNGFWVCDNTRLDFKWANSPKRMDRPHTRQGDVSWEKGLTLAHDALTKARSDKESAWALIHASATNEELYLFRKLFKETLGIENIAVMALPDGEALNFPQFKSPADRNANRFGAQMILGVKNAEESTAKFIAAAEAGTVKHAIVCAGFAHGVQGIEPVAKALGSQSVQNITVIDFQQSLLTELAHLTLPSQTYFETGGSWVNCDLRLQAFRASLPFPLKGRAMTEIFQDLIAKLATPEQPSATTTIGDNGVAVAVAVAASTTVKPRVIIGAAAIFDELVKAVPQFAGHSHLSLIRSKGAKLL
ncbi:MAG: (2Fe-2S)-binding protein [Planctomycetes bacterium]|nr:(2Fe-2S)-binding protein [Planctomycetota bacterium]